MLGSTQDVAMHSDIFWEAEYSGGITSQFHIYRSGYLIGFPEEIKLKLSYKIWAETI